MESYRKAESRRQRFLEPIIVIIPVVLVKVGTIFSGRAEGASIFAIASIVASPKR
jgi:hypothetical protein